jgi:uncharacterized membrane protein
MDCQERHPEDTEQSVARLLLSHHPPEHIGRTLCVKCGRNRLRICARCSGILFGACLLAAAWALGVVAELSSAILPIVLICLSLPAVVDFNAQLVTRIESTNRRRLITGATFGFAVSYSICAALGGRLWAPAFVIAIVLAGFVWLVVSKRRLIRLLQHLRLYGEYFERCRCEDVRRAARKRVVEA